MKIKYRKNRAKSANFQDVTVSQNFLTSRRLLERIVGRSTITDDDLVVEIGTGKGHLTKVLAEKCRLLISVEIDRALYEYSKKKLIDCKNVKLIYGDFLNYRLPRKGKYKIFANIPYNLTTEIVVKLSKTYNPPTEMWLVMEKGATKRFMGKPNENNRSRELTRIWDMNIVYYFKRDDFHPKPEVDSVLLHFEQRK